MKALASICAATTALAIVACGGSGDYVSKVDPYIGSGGHGHVFVGANVPNGMIQVGPQNIHKGWDWCSGYHYSDSIVIGFTHTHLNGTGCADLGDILLMPYTGDVRTSRGSQEDISGSCSSYYSHDNETVRPGYYSLTMDNGIGVELTATERVALHRYTYPAGQTPRLLINLQEGNGDTAYETSLTKVDDYTIEGYRFSSGWSRHKVYFCLRTEQPIASIALFEGDAPAADNSETITGRGVKGVVTFADDPTQVALRVAISSVSCQNARLNMDAETDGFQFAKVERQATDKWNRRLSQIKVEGGDPRTEKIFYTALYHAMIAPTIYCDVNGQYRGIDDKVRTADGWTNYSCFSLWDTYRTLNPLLTILSPSMVNDIVRSFLSIYDEQGKLPIWTLVGGETNCMPGYSSVPIIADAYMKGIRGYDAGKALDAMVATATNPAQNGVPYLLEKGYIPCDKVHEATSIALEYAADDWGTALMAKEMGRTDLYEEYMRRGHAYETYFDRTLNYIRPKMDDGSWRTPYDPFKSVHSVGDFTEGTGWQYTFFVPQHPEGLIALMGGDDAFVTKLDSLFSVEGDMGAEASSDISGLIGQYAHGNEPSHHVAYLYPYAGQQWKTAEKVRYIDREFYTDSPDGIIGNEDCGQMSAWYIMSAMGFYQVNPSNGVFVFGSPLFPSLTLRLENGRSFTVTAEGNSDTNIYIQSATLNGQPYEKSYITYDDIMVGGELHFVMGDKPNKSFGAAPESRPVSAQ